MNPLFQMTLTTVCAVMASSGFWAFMLQHSGSKDTKTQMLIGLGHDRIMYLGMCYIERHRTNGEGITQDEYENLNDYLYAPYKKLGGNGSAERIMIEVNKIPIRKSK